MSATELIIIAVIVLLLVAGAALFIRERRSRALRERFGPEYRRAVEESGAQSKGEADLAAREKRVRKYKLRSLTPDERQRCLAEWRTIQARFVDNPKDAAAKADDLLGRVMSARGYPDGDFDQRLEDLSVDHGETVQNYRAGHDVMLRRTRGDATTEDMRQAIIHFRTLFDELVGDGEAPPMRAAS